MSNLALERGLPANPEAEKMILGTILLDDTIFQDLEGKLEAEHFAIEVHQRVYRRMSEIHKHGERVDRITLANCLMSHRELEQVGGLAFLISLDDGLPRLPNLDGYIRIIRDKYALRSLISAGQAIVNQALLDTQSPDEIIQSAEGRIGNISTGLVSAKTAFSFGDVVDEAGGIAAIVGPRTRGVPTGYPCLDNLCFGLEPAVLYVIGGDSSHGKSTWAGNIAVNVATGYDGTDQLRDQSPVAIVSLEMSRRDIFRRMLCAKGKVSAWKMDKGFLDKQERGRLNFAAADLNRAPLYIDDATSLKAEDGGMSVRKFGARVRTLVREKGIKGAVLDYLQLIDWRADGLKSEYEGVTYTTWFCKQIAKELGIWVMLLTQFHQEYSRRKDKSTRPTVDSCHGSGSIKKDADVVWLLYRMAQAHPNNAEFRKTMEHIVAKQRNGRTGTIVSNWERDQYRFDEKLAEEQPGYGEDA